MKRIWLSSFLLILFVGLGGLFAQTTSAATDITWNSTQIGPNYASAYRGITYGNGKYVLVGDVHSIRTSTDGVEWTSNKLIYPTLSNEPLTIDFRNFYLDTFIRDVTYGQGKFVLVGLGGLIGSSNDTGSTWNFSSWTKSNYISFGTKHSLNSVSYGNDTFVAVGENGVILTSNDGDNWSIQASNTENHLFGVDFVKDRFIAVGVSGTVLTSTDGITWVNQTTGTTRTLRSASYGNETFVIVGDNGSILTSNDGVNWTARSVPSDASGYSFNSVTYSGATFVAVGNQYSLYSTDGIVWKAKSINGEIYYGVVSAEGRFVAVGSFYYIAIGNDGLHDASLEGLLTSAGSLDPVFSSSITDYVVNVSNDITSLKLTPLAAYNGTQVKVNGSIVTNGTDSEALSLDVGSNEILVETTALDGTTKKTYTIIVNRSAPLIDNADLRDLTLSQGNLSPAFEKDVVSYTASVPYRFDSITVTPSALYSGIITKINGSTVADGTASEAISLNVGSNEIIVETIAIDGVTTKTYTIIVERTVPLVDNADLFGLTLSQGSISPAFSEDNSFYTANVNYAYSSITVTPIAREMGTTIKVNNVAVTSGSASQAINLDVGSNTISIGTVSESGDVTKMYILVVTRATSHNSFLNGIDLMPGDLNSDFHPDTYDYTAHVATHINSFTITPTVQDSGATVKVNGVLVASGTPSGDITLNDGSALVTIEVTAVSGSTSFYTVMVTRKDTSLNETKLSYLGLAQGGLSPSFDSNVYHYTSDIESNISQVTVQVINGYRVKQVKVNGVVQTEITENGDMTQVVSLEVGTNTIKVETLAEDGKTVNEYTIVVNLSRPISSNADLSSLDLSSGSLTPLFASGTTDYTASVGNSVSSITVTPTVADSTASVTVNGTAVISGSASGAINLNVGVNTITVVVTAQDGVTTNTYELTVTREAAPLSSNADLSGLSLSSGSISPAFGSGIVDYTASVGNSVSSITVTPTVADSTASVTVNGTAVTSGSASGAISLNVGVNTITVVVTAQDGVTTNTYTLTVTREAAPLSSNANLSNLGLSSGSLSPAFSFGTVDYTASVANSVRSLSITPTVADSTASVTVNGTVVTSGSASGAINLAVGVNTITVVVTAQDGVTTKTYTLTITRAAAVRDDSSPVDSGSSPSTGSGKVTSTTGTIKLPMGSSGEVSLSNAVTITIPTGSFTQELEVTIDVVTNTEGLFTEVDVPLSPIYEILKSVSEDFTKPVTLTFTFDPTSLKSDQDIAVFYYDEVKKVWVQIDGGTIVGNKITVEVDHFTKFAVMAITKEQPAPVSPIFQDIIGHWAEDSIIKAAQGGVVNGYGNNVFKPDGFVTRAEFVVMLVKALQLEEPAAKTTFTDSEHIGSWAQKAIEQAVQASIVTGYLDGSFRPNAEITRAEMAVMISKALALKLEAGVQTNFIDDQDIPSWAKPHIAELNKLGLINGKGSNKFAPNDKATRAEAVTIIMKLIQLEMN